MVVSYQSPEVNNGFYVPSVFSEDPLNIPFNAFFIQSRPKFRSPSVGQDLTLHPSDRVDTRSVGPCEAFSWRRWMKIGRLKIMSAGLRSYVTPSRMVLPAQYGRNCSSCPDTSPSRHPCRHCGPGAAWRGSLRQITRNQNPNPD